MNSDFRIQNNTNGCWLPYPKRKPKLIGLYSVQILNMSLKPLKVIDASFDGEKLVSCDANKEIRDTLFYSYRIWIPKNFEVK